MKRFIALLLCVFGLLAAPLRADVELSFDFYYDQLSPMGEWVEVDGYGYVWHPNGVDEDWAPYIDGYWTYTDAGWTWVSYEDWGAICYHYGRWVHLLDYGWCWVPGYDWGPAWVSWRSSDDYIGWAPLPPECDWNVDRGVSVWVDTHYDIGPRWYSFCRVRDFGAPFIRPVCLPRIRNFEICFSTVNITNISYNRGYGCVFNGGLDYDYIRSRSDRRVPALKLVQNTTNIFINNNRGNVFVNSPRGNALVVAAPRVAVNANQFTRKPAIRRSFDRNAVTRGWNGVDKPETRDRLVSKMRAETKGLTPANAKARPVKEDALAVVPKEVKLDAPTPGMKRLPAERGNRETAREPGSERVTPAEREGRIEKMKPNERGETAKVPQDGDAGKPNGRGPVAGAENRNGGLRKRPNGEAGETADLERSTATVPGIPAEKRAGEVGKPDRVAKPENRPADPVPGGVAGPEDRTNDKPEKAARTTEMREAQENGRRQAQENAESAARARQENAAREKSAREGAERQANQRDQAEAARAAEMKRQGQENAGRESAARENAAREQAAQAAAVRRAQMEAQQEKQNRAGEQAEAAQRQAAQRAENARRAAAEQQNENARRQVMERQNEARQQAAQRQAEAQRERAAAQQNEGRQRAAEVMRERAANAQREQASENARARAMENQQRAAAAHAQERAQAQQQQQQQRAAAQAQAAARQQSEARSQQQDSDDRKKKR